MQIGDYRIRAKVGAHLFSAAARALGVANHRAVNGKDGKCEYPICSPPARLGSQLGNHFRALLFKDVRQTRAPQHGFSGNPWCRFQSPASSACF
jgi:hypothetical protein